jgi:hypothetical protein
MTKKPAKKLDKDLDKNRELKTPRADQWKFQHHANKTRMRTGC